MSKVWAWLLIILIVATLAVGGVYAYQQYFQKDKEATETAETQTEETADWQTYTNSELGYEVSYPQDATLSGQGTFCLEIKLPYGYVNIRDINWDPDANPDDIGTCLRTGVGSQYKSITFPEPIIFLGQSKTVEGMYAESGVEETYEEFYGFNINEDDMADIEATIRMDKENGPVTLDEARSNIKKILESFKTI